jgi:hypothetical protein
MRDVFNFIARDFTRGNSGGEMIVNSIDDFMTFVLWARKRAQALAMKVEECGLCELEPQWTTMTTEISRPDGAFFKVRGVNVTHAAGREVSGWKQPMICENGIGYVALITHDFHNPNQDGMALVRIKTEPGNLGITLVCLEDDNANTRALVCPPVQFSKGNLENHRRALLGENDPNGKPYMCVPFADLALEESLPDWVDTASWCQASEDGGRFFEKLNRYGHISVKNGMLEQIGDVVEATGQPEDFAWVSRSVLRRVLTCQGRLANGHLRSVASLLI